MRRCFQMAVVCSVLVGAAGCTTSGTGVVESASTTDLAVLGSQQTSADSIRQVDANGVRLPFTTVFPNRWNSANSGTEYEPCTALTAAELRAIGVDSSTVADAAGTNGQTLRGCEWDFLGRTDAAVWNVSQFVGNSPSLEHDKRQKSASFDVWLTDQMIKGRTVGVHYMQDMAACATYVQSGGAAVDTVVSVTATPRPPIEEICERALAYTRATIGKIPL